MSASSRPSSGHEELAISVRGTRRVSTALITVLLSVTGSGGVVYGMTAAERERSEVDRRLAEGAAAAQETERRLLLDRICTLERELVAEVSARVSLSAADAEPTRSRKAQTAALAVRHFDDVAKDWPCPDTAADRESRTDRPLWKRAANAMPATVPGR
jgi:hypothetical protein